MSLRPRSREEEDAEIAAWLGAFEGARPAEGGAAVPEPPPAPPPLTKEERNRIERNLRPRGAHEELGEWPD